MLYKPCIVLDCCDVALMFLILYKWLKVQYVRIGQLFNLYSKQKGRSISLE